MRRDDKVEQVQRLSDINWLQRPVERDHQQIGCAANSNRKCMVAAYSVLMLKSIIFENLPQIIKRNVIWILPDTRKSFLALTHISNSPCGATSL